MKNIKLAFATTITRAYPNFYKPLTIDRGKRLRYQRYKFKKMRKTINNQWHISAVRNVSLNVIMLLLVIKFSV